MTVNTHLRDQLIAMAGEDQRVRAQLAADGSLFDGYHPSMESVHLRNAARLEAIFGEHGWPGWTLVGAEGSRAAWMILQHAISRPDLQRRCLTLLRRAAARGDVPLIDVAMLDDRVRVFEGRPQLYGTQFDWDEQGEMSPLPIHDPANVDERRRAVGLPPLDERIAEARRQSAEEGERPPADFADRARRVDEWARATGWRT